jgi:hypothetical protein
MTSFYGFDAQRLKTNGELLTDSSAISETSAFPLCRNANIFR